MEKIIIAAVADDGAIGVGGDLPWHLRGDLRFFKQQTTGFPVIMGRRTWESLGRPLPGRLNIVVSSSLPSDTSGCTVVSSLEAAFAAAGDAEKCFVIGGGQLYRQAMPQVDTLLLTRVHVNVPEADTFFPLPAGAQWRVAECSPEQEEDGVKYEFVKYVRK